MTGDQLDIPITHRKRTVRISVRLRRSGDDVVMFLHGLGCAKESFDGAFRSGRLRGLSLCSFDFPGFGASDRWPPDDYSLETYARLAALLAERLRTEFGVGAGRVTLVGHSMGGAVAALAAHDIPALHGLVSVEGNLVADDCGMVSRRIAEQTQTAFLSSGYRELGAELDGSRAKDMRTWASWYAAADAAAVHRSARSLVEWSDSEKLLDVFNGLGTSAAYIYGAADAKAHLLPRLEHCDVRRIDRAGHFLMVDRPRAFYRVLTEVLGSRRRGPARISLPPYRGR